MGALTAGYKKNNQGGNISTQQQGTMDVVSLFQQKRDFFVAFYGQHGYKRGMETAIAIATDNKFKECSSVSISEAIFAAARIGLDIELNEAWLVPYGQTVQFQIGRKGWTKLLYNSTAGWLIDAEPIYEADRFEYEITEDGKKISYIPNLFDREEEDTEWVFQNLKAFYLCATDRENRKIHKIVTKNQIEKLRLNSPGQKRAGRYTKDRERNRINQKLPVDIWEQWYLEMATTKAIKLFAKQLPIGDRVISKAIKLDDLAEVGEEAEFVAESATIDAEACEKPKTDLSEKSKNSSLMLIGKIKESAESLGVKVGEPTKSHGKTFIQAIPPESGQFNADALFDIGFKHFPKKNVWAMDITHLMSA